MSLKPAQFARAIQDSAVKMPNFSFLLDPKNVPLIKSTLLPSRTKRNVRQREKKKKETKEKMMAERNGPSS